MSIRERLKLALLGCGGDAIRTHKSPDHLIATSSHRLGLFLLAVTVIALLAACQPERVEYHRRPAFFERASTQPLSDEVVLEDGTVVKYRSAHRPGIAGYKGEDGSKPFQTREEHEDGSVTLRALLPEHVLVNTLVCVRNQEYELMWDQLVAEQTRRLYEQNEQGLEEFAAFFQRHRHDLSSTLTRMVAGIPSQEVKIVQLGGGVTRLQLRPQIAEPFRFKALDVINEDGELRLLMIH